MITAQTKTLTSKPRYRVQLKMINNHSQVPIIVHIYGYFMSIFSF